MTRLEVVEEIAKGNLDESAMKLNKREREYLDRLQKNLIEPLKKIQQAGLQNERADKVYRGIVENKAIQFRDAKRRMGVSTRCKFFHGQQITRLLQSRPRNRTAQTNCGEQKSTCGRSRTSGT